MLKLIKQHSVLALTLLAIFLVKIPPFYFLGITSTLLTSHTLARYLIFALFLVSAWQVFFGKGEAISQNGRNLTFVFLAYFFFQSFSVVGAESVEAFARVYKDIVFPGFFLFVVLFQTGIANGLAKIFVAAGIVNFFYQMAILLVPGAFRLFGERFIYSEHFQLVDINIQRGRLFVETYDEIAIPVILLLLFKEKRSKVRLGYLLVLVMIVVPSLLSNFRTRFLMLFFALTASFLIVVGGRLKAKLSLIGSLFVLAFIAHSVSFYFFGFSFLNRLALEDPGEDVQTIQSRFANLKASLDMGLARPLSGVGLNNYYYHLSEGRKGLFSISLNLARQREAEFASVNPHNIFAQIISETGILSFCFYLFMLGFFAKADIGIFKGKDGLKKSLAISFWTLFLYSIFNPTATLAYNSLFWILRAALIQDSPLRSLGNRSSA